MSEGELKNRLKRMQELTNVNADSVWLLSGLDEAIKEFPYNKEHLNNPELGQLIKDYLAMIDWFLKWFGEKK